MDLIVNVCLVGNMSPLVGDNNREYKDPQNFRVYVTCPHSHNNISVFFSFFLMYHLAFFLAGK